MYKNLIKYYNDNEITSYNECLLNDTYNEELLYDIKNHLTETEMLQDLETVIIKEMFMYYIKHNK